MPDKEIRQQQESMSARRLKTQRRINDLWNSEPTTGENSEQPMAEVNQTLHWAGLNGHEAIVQMLLDRGADVAAKDQSGRTPLHRAAKNGHEAVVQMLVDRGADVAAKDQWGRTPLHRAAKNGHEAVVQMLVDRGADVA